MRNNRKPLWEDAENSQGGQWKLKCNKNDTVITKKTCSRCEIFGRIL